jgi:hypothetical protein
VTIIDLTGQTFGRLTAVERAPGKWTRWLCRCTCGVETAVTSANLRSGDTSSCGCLRRESQRERMAALHKQVSGVCEVCGITFTGTISGNRPRRFCSPACERGSRLRPIPPQTCTVCGVVFAPRRRGQFDCSPACCKIGRARRRAERDAAPPLPVRACEICGSQFQPRRKSEILCSQATSRSPAKCNARRAMHC